MTMGSAMSFAIAVLLASKGSTFLLPKLLLLSLLCLLEVVGCVAACVGLVVLPATALLFVVRREVRAHLFVVVVVVGGTWAGWDGLV